MPELRKDPIVGRWVIIATERARRPGNFIDSQESHWEQNGSQCPFCVDGEVARLPEIYAHQNGSGWKVRVVPSGTPILKPEDHCSRRGHGMYDVVNGYGAHEVVIETPQHIPNLADLDVHQIQAVLQTYAARFNDLEKNPNFKYILAYKNYGWTAGSRKIGHARSQIIAAPVTPLRVKEKLIGAKKYFDYHERCIYCDLIAQERREKDRVILETENFIVIAPFAARFLFETWILPKRHHCDFAKNIGGLEYELAQVMKNLLTRLKVGLEDPAYNFVIQTAPLQRNKTVGKDWKTIEEDYHWHIEVMPRLTRVAGFEKGTGFYICPVPPEYTAEYLRKVEV